MDGRQRVVFVLLVFVLLGGGGCASLKTNAGFDIVNADRQAREQPWQANALSGVNTEQLKEVKQLTVIQLPVDPEWLGDLGTMVEDKTSPKGKIVRRQVWRVFCSEGGSSQMFPGLINSFGSWISVLVPHKRPEDVSGWQCAALSGASTRVLLMGGTIRELMRGETVDDILRKRISPVNSDNVADMSPGTAEGDAFISSLVKRFPLAMGLENGDYAASPEAFRTMGNTPQEKYLDRVTSRGGMKISPLAVAGGVYTLSWQAAHLVVGLSSAAISKSFSGPYGEAVFPQWAADEVFDFYLNNCRRVLASYGKSVAEDVQPKELADDKKKKVKTVSGWEAARKYKPVLLQYHAALEQCMRRRR